MEIIKYVVIIPVWLLKDIELSEEWKHILGGLLLFCFIRMIIRFPFILMKDRKENFPQ